MARVLHVIDSLDPSWGGTTRACLDLARALADVGHDVCIATVDPTRAAPAVARRDGVTIHSFPTSTTGRFAGSGQLRRWLWRKTRDADVVAIHDVWALTTGYAAVAARRHGVPYVLHPHGSLEPTDLRKHARAKRLIGPLAVRPVLSAAHALICTSEREARQANRYGAAVATRVVPLPVIAPTEWADRDASRAALHLGDNQVALLHLGRIDPKKGLERTLRALGGVEGAWQLLVAGTGEEGYVAQLQKLASELGVADRCRWLGQVADSSKAAAWAAADAFVLASDMENFGIAVVEAAQHGLPLVLSTEVHIAHSFATTGAALMVTPDVPPLREALQRVVDDPSRRVAMSAAARTTADDTFSVGAAARAYAEALPLPTRTSP